jgi:hypothetical protein
MTIDEMYLDSRGKILWIFQLGKIILTVQLGKQKR